MEPIKKPMSEWTDEEMKEITESAFKAARDAELEFLKKHGEPMYCGFAWVTIDPGTSRYAKFLMREYSDRARKGYPKGVTVWNPGGSFSQSMDLKECGSEAFARELRKHGIRAHMGSRAD